MLMDLLFSHCHELGLQPCRRVHFHGFMLEVHATLHEIRQVQKAKPIVCEASKCHSWLHPGLLALVPRPLAKTGQLVVGKPGI